MQRWDCFTPRAPSPFSLPQDTLSAGTTIEGLTPRPDISNPRSHGESLLWVGGEISKQKGELLTYHVNGKFGLAGAIIGDIDVTADIRSRFRLWNDTVQLRAYGFFKNSEPSYFYKKYTSNHFIWDNDFELTSNESQAIQHKTVENQIERRCRKYTKLYLFRQ